jgi:hypothetical protein
MEVGAVAGSGRSAVPGRPNALAAQIAEARRLLRVAGPAGSEDAVSAEVQRLQDDHGVPLLAALHAVRTRLADGWTPSAGPSGR